MLPLPEITRRLHRWAPGPLPPAPDGRQQACRRRQTGDDRPAAGARRERTSLPPAPDGRRRACHRRRVLPSVPCPASAGACCCLPSLIPGAHGPFMPSREFIE
ncbi:hypothetical protein Bca101_020626 [Brassica carinata]